MTEKTVLEVVRAIVVSGSGADKVLITVATYKEAVFPYSGPLTLHFDAAKGSGAQWVIQNFGIEPKVVGD
jgi:hypothetical protein